MFAFVGGYYLGLVPKFQQVEVSDRPVTAEELAKLEQLYQELEFDLKPASETTKQPPRNESSAQEKRFTRFNLTQVEAKAEILRLRNAKHNQTQIIKILWDAKPGENEAYKQALTEYKQLISDE
jgi:hypothetical protein